ncbi:MAG: TonB family protein / TonB-dependent receptor [Myxococcaceae bacterium]|nr:TonB family protein / TonB-dependent receptor [Myxococcaceae bacterium]
MPGLPPADDIPPLPDMPGLPPADDMPKAEPKPGRPKSTVAADESDAGETVVRVRRRARAVTSTRTSAAEAKRLPGTQGDAIRVIESLPGVGRASFASGDLLLWGASPDSSRIYVDGVPIPRLFHGGGLRSVLNGFFVKELELVPGAYGADYGGASAGMVRITTAPLQEGVHGVAQVDVLDSSAAVSYQASKKLFVGGGFRYGYLSRLAPLVASKEALQYTIIPKYSDYQARAEWRLSENSRISALYMGSRDRGQANFTSDDPARARSSQRDADFQRLELSYSASMSSGKTVRVMGYFGADASTRADVVGPYPFRLKSQATVFGMRASYIGDLNAHLRLHAGVAIDASLGDLNRQGSLTRPPREGDPYAFGQAPAGDLAADAWKVTQVTVAPYLEMPITLFDKRLDITPGLYVAGMLNNVSQAVPPIGDTPTHGTAAALTFVEPRLMTNFRATSRLSLKLGGGLYHSAPNPNDLSSAFGTPTLKAPRSTQGIVGGTYELPWNLTFEAVAFARRIERYVSRNLASAIPAGEVLTLDGRGRAYGGQFSLRRRFANGFTGWLSYTLTHSQVRYHDSAAWVPSDFEQRHLFTGVASYDLGKGFAAGLRLRVITGLPRTPVSGRVYDTVNGDYQPLFGQYNSTRLPTIYALDARIDKTFVFGNAKLIIFLDALNVLNRAPAEEIIYDSTYAQHDYLRGLPIVADLGIRGEL